MNIQVTKEFLDAIFKSNRLLEIQLEVPGGEETEGEFFPGHVEQAGLKTIAIASLTPGGFPVPVRIGAIVSLRMFRFGCLYTFQAQVQGRQKEPLAVVILSTPRSINKLQLRDWVRIKLDVPIYYRMAGYPVDYYRSIGYDISGGGICLLTNHFIDIDTLLDLKIKLPDLLIPAIGRVKRCSIHDGATFYRTGIQYEQIDERHQEEIISYIFLKQREIINKGIGYF